MVAGKVAQSVEVNPGVFVVVSESVVVERKLAQ
jgi:hypothetical protein